MKLRHCMGPLMAFFFVIFPAQTRSEEKPLTGIAIQVAGLLTNDGFVFCDLYDNAKGFPNQPAKALLRMKVRPDREKATCVFPDALAGRYAVALWHDVNADQKLGTNWVGIPTEPVGASNNAKGQFGPPKLQDAAFEDRPPLFKQNIRLE